MCGGRMILHATPGLFLALFPALAGISFAGPRLVLPEKQFEAKCVEEGEIEIRIRARFKEKG